MGAEDARILCEGLTRELHSQDGGEYERGVRVINWRRHSEWFVGLAVGVWSG